VLPVFNDAPAADVRARLRACCAADAWIEAIVAGRPYPSEAALAAASDTATARLSDTGLAQALAGHPRIGSAPPGRSAAGSPADWSRREQSGVSGADADTRAALADANAAYERRFGHVYLVCAIGLSAAELLAICRSRLGNSPEAERYVVLAELAKINRLRLTKLLTEEFA
jgi:2-oxo-4-hydroxy-4-carboxy-5-ureidoimidazoline decarboxylase